MKKENKKDFFKRIVEARVNRILDEFRLLGQCSNKNNYSYSDKDVKKIFNALELKLKYTKELFNERSLFNLESE